jgi:hypothetical protein
MLKKRAILILVLGVTLLTGCNILQPTGPTGGGREYFPNADGNSWTYLQTYSTTTETATQRLTISGTHTFDSITAQIMVSEYLTTTSISTSEILYVVSDAGVYIYGFLSSPTTEATTVCSFPLYVGNKWTFFGSAEAEVEEKEDISVHAGDFTNCYRVLYTDGSSGSMYAWFAPDAGIIKQTNVFSGSGGTTQTVTIELTSKNF